MGSNEIELRAVRPVYLSLSLSLHLCLSHLSIAANALAIYSTVAYFLPPLPDFDLAIRRVCMCYVPMQNRATIPMQTLNGNVNGGARGMKREEEEGRRREKAIRNYCKRNGGALFFSGGASIFQP